MDEALFTDNLAWAQSIAQSIGRGLPPSFDIDDLMQTAIIEHWRRVKSFDASRGLPYRAYAYQPIHGAVLMACRRRNYREATHEELGVLHIDEKERPDVVLLKREERRNVSGPRERRQIAKVRMALDELPPADAYLISRCLAGNDAQTLANAWGGDVKIWARRITRATQRLKRAVR